MTPARLYMAAELARSITLIAAFTACLAPILVVRWLILGGFWLAELGKQ